MICNEAGWAVRASVTVVRHGERFHVNTVRELTVTRCFMHVLGRCQPKWKRAYIASVHIFVFVQ
jgi:hypothetical protein